MTTPEMQVQSVNAQFNHRAPGSVRVDTLSPAGAAIDVSSGYTLYAFQAFPSNGPNPANGGVDLSSHVSAVFDSTGVTISWTQAQENTMAALLQCLGNTLEIGLTNDSGTTANRIALGSLNADPNYMFV